MGSRVAEQLRRERAARLAAMTASERVAVAARLGEQGLRSYMATFGVDRTTAITRIKATHRIGRRLSLSSADDD